MSDYDPFSGEGATSAGNKADDFTAALRKANEPVKPPASAFPSAFPDNPESMIDREHEQIDPPKERGTEPMFAPGEVEAKYVRFDLSDPEAVEELEKIQNLVMRGEAMQAREEWVHTRSGGTFVILKYLLLKKKKKKSSSGGSPVDAALAAHGLDRSES